MPVDGEEERRRGGITKTTIQAPSWNFVTAKTTTTIAVQHGADAVDHHLQAPARVVAQRRAALADLLPGGRRPIFHQRRVIPACESVKDRNTPIA